MSLHNRINRSHVHRDENVDPIEHRDTDDVIRRLKLLSKAQTAFLKQHLQGKLTLADSLVSRAVNLLDKSLDAQKHKSKDLEEANTDTLEDLRNELLDLHLEELEVNTDSVKLQLADEMALLRNHLAQLPAAATSDGTSILPPAPPNATGDAAAIHAAVTAHKTRIAELEAENKTVNEQMKRMKTEVTTLKVDKEALQQQLITAELSNVTVSEAVLVGSAAGPSTTNSAASDAQLLQLQNNLAQAKNSNESLIAKVAALELTVSELKESQDVQEKTWKSNDAKNEEQLNKLQKELAIHQQHAKSAQDQSSSKANISPVELDLLRNELQSIKQQVTELQQQAADKEKALDHAQNALKNAHSELTEQQQELSKQGEVVEQLQQTEEKQQQEIAKLQSSVAATSAESNASLAQREEIIQQKTVELAKLTDALNGSKAAITAMEAKHATAITAETAQRTALVTSHESKIATMLTTFEEEKEQLMEALSEEIEVLEQNQKSEKEMYEKKVDQLSTSLHRSEQSRQQLTQCVVKTVKKFTQVKSNQKQLKADTTKKLTEYRTMLQTVLGPALISRALEQSKGFADMQAKLLKEALERKRLHNVIQELKGNIRVFLRCRPPSNKELEQFGNDALCVSFPLSSVDGEGGSDGGSMVRVVNDKGKDKIWEFDQVFDLNSTQEGVYKEVSELVTSMMDGYNVCIFAYGQTGSGKTFTMAGPQNNAGVNTRALEELFQKSRKRQEHYSDTITVSVLEVYNEDIRDLLTESNGEKLEVRQSNDGSGNCVPGLTMVRVNSLSDVVQLLAIADRFRTSSATNMNEHSSRSHMMLTVYVVSENRATGAVSRGKLNLVDLAGSERLNKSGATGVALKEAQNINKSLSALGDVIAARAAKQGHIPFRNSTLTFLLQDSLSQDSKTLMFVCVSPVLYNAEETFCSLNFAARVRAVELGKASKHIAAGNGSGASGSGIPPSRSTGPSPKPTMR